LRTASSVQKGRFTVSDDDTSGGGGGGGSGGGGGQGSGASQKKTTKNASSMIVGASELEPGTVAHASKEKAAAAAERELDPPRLKMRGLYDAAQAAQELAAALKQRHEDMEDEEKKINQLVEDNRWLRTRVAELEQMLLGGGGDGE
jgi:hypothetical protein